jgi:membrane associated rhomboid family serine protease
METCYRHPDRETGVSCSSCGRSICPDCMTATPVGMRCPECSKQKTKVHSMRTMHANPTVTIAIIVVCVLAYFGTQTSREAFQDGAGELWRLVTSGFLHANLIHIAFNMYLLWLLGGMLEPVLGNVRFAALYATGLLSGSFGALLLSPDALTVGASGAVYGLMGAALVMQRARGVDVMQSGIGPLILLNLAFTFFFPGISIGGHLGGLAGGMAAGFLMDQAAGRRRGIAIPVLICVGIAAAAVAGSLVITST